MGRRWEYWCVYDTWLGVERAPYFWGGGQKCMASIRRGAYLGDTLPAMGCRCDEREGEVKLLEGMVMRVRDTLKEYQDPHLKKLQYTFILRSILVSLSQEDAGRQTIKAHARQSCSLTLSLFSHVVSSYPYLTHDSMQQRTYMCIPHTHTHTHTTMLVQYLHSNQQSNENPPTHRKRKRKRVLKRRQLTTYNTPG